MVTKFDGDIGSCEGQVLAAWFIANPAGPTAFAVGYVEFVSKRMMFYRHMHFTGSTTWLAEPLEEEMKAWEGEFSGILMNTLLLLNNHFAVNGGDLPILREIPSVIITNDNPSIKAAFFEFLKLSTTAEDWGRRVYYDEKYGSDFFLRLEEEYREIFERFEADSETDENYLAFLAAEHGHRDGFRRWLPDQYVSSQQTSRLLYRWYQIVTDDEYTRQGIYQICEMWIGACHRQKSTGLLETLKNEGRLFKLKDVLSFYESMNMPPSGRLPRGSHCEAHGDLHLIVALPIPTLLNQWHAAQIRDLNIAFIAACICFKQPRRSCRPSDAKAAASCTRLGFE